MTVPIRRRARELAMQTLYQHQWEGFDYEAAQKIVVKLIANDMLTLRWIEWNGDQYK